MIEVRRCRNCDCYVTAAECTIHDGYCGECYEFIVDDKLELKESETEEDKIERGKKLLKEFEYVRNMAELKALSNVSLERPLSNEEFNKMMDLKTILIKEGETK